MASIKTLNANNLELLGAARLATLLIEISTGNSVAQRRLRLELAGAAGADDAARAIHKRLTAIAAARTFVDWHRTKALVTDLEAQHRAIVQHVAPADPREALALLWRFLGLAESIFARCDDGSGRVLAVFTRALPDLASLAAAAKPAALAARMFEALRQGDRGPWDGLIETLAPHLGAAGLADLKARFETWLAEPDAPETRISGTLGSAERERFAASRSEARLREAKGRAALRQIADAQGDVDGYIAQHDPQARSFRKIAANIATRLLAAGRADEALDALDRVDVAGAEWGLTEWEDARIEVLEALERHEEAQAFRWERFGTSLGVHHLRGWLRKYRGFDDFEGEQRAFAHVATFPDVHRAAAFLIAWPALDRANALVLARAAELDGDRYETLTPLAEALAPSYPLAATLALRAMIDFALGRARSSRYGHARQHLESCAALAGHVPDFGDYPDHAAYERSLRAAHGRKSGFWRADG